MMERLQMNTSGNNDIDHISGLSEPIIHSILSLLPPDDLRNIPLLSKHFKSLWTRFPIIYFHFNRPDQDLFTRDHTKNTNKFLAYVKRSIQLRQLNTDLKKFSLRFLPVKLPSDSRVDEIISFALNNNVQDLDLQFSSPLMEFERFKLKKGFKSTSLTDLNFIGIDFDIDLLISSCPSLKILTLANCSVSETESLKMSSYPCLRKLSFTFVTISYMWIEECVVKSANLESLKVNCLGNSTGFRVANQKLQNFEFFGTSLEVVAPNLRSLYLGSNTNVKDKWLKALVSSLQNLENLKLEGCRELEWVELFNDSIRSLELLDCDNVVEVAVDARKLTSFVYRGRITVFTLMNSSRFFNSTLELKGGVEIHKTDEDDAWNGLRELLSFFSHCETLTLVCFSRKDFIIPENIRARRLPPLYGVKHLRIKYHQSKDKEIGPKLFGNKSKVRKLDPKLVDDKSKDIKIDPDLVDNFLWLSPHLKSLSFAQDSEKEKIIELHYDSENETTDEDCCRGLPFRCWRDDFKDIELKNFDATDYKDQLWKYFDESAILSGNSLPSFARSIGDRE